MAEATEQTDSVTGAFNIFPFERHKDLLASEILSSKNADRFSDAIILCEGVHFCVHKVCLATVSPYLLEILKSFIEQETPVITIMGFSVAVVKMFIEFVYTGVTYCDRLKLSSFTNLLNLLEVDGDNIACNMKTKKRPSSKKTTKCIKVNEIPPSVEQSASDVSNLISCPNSDNTPAGKILFWDGLPLNVDAEDLLKLKVPVLKLQRCKYVNPSLRKKRPKKPRKPRGKLGPELKSPKRRKAIPKWQRLLLSSHLDNVSASSSPNETSSERGSVNNSILEDHDENQPTTSDNPPTNIGNLAAKPKRKRLAKPKSKIGVIAQGAAASEPISETTEQHGIKFSEPCKRKRPKPKSKMGVATQNLPISGQPDGTRAQHNGQYGEPCKRIITKPKRKMEPKVQNATGLNPQTGILAQQSVQLGEQFLQGLDAPKQYVGGHLPIAAALGDQIEAEPQHSIQNSEPCLKKVAQSKPKMGGKVQGLQGGPAPAHQIEITGQQQAAALAALCVAGMTNVTFTPLLNEPGEIASKQSNVSASAQSSIQKNGIFSTPQSGTVSKHQTGITRHVNGMIVPKHQVGASNKHHPVPKVAPVNTAFQQTASTQQSNAFTNVSLPKGVTITRVEDPKVSNQMEKSNYGVPNSATIGSLSQPGQISTGSSNNTLASCSVKQELVDDVSKGPLISIISEASYVGSTLIAAETAGVSNAEHFSNMKKTIEKTVSGSHYKHDHPFKVPSSGSDAMKSSANAPAFLCYSGISYLPNQHQCNDVFVANCAQRIVENSNILTVEMLREFLIFLSNIVSPFAVKLFLHLNYTKFWAKVSKMFNISYGQGEQRPLSQGHCRIVASSLISHPNNHVHPAASYSNHHKSQQPASLNQHHHPQISSNMADNSHTQSLQIGQTAAVYIPPSVNSIPVPCHPSVGSSFQNAGPTPVQNSYQVPVSTRNFHTTPGKHTSYQPLEQLNLMNESSRNRSGDYPPASTYFLGHPTYHGAPSNQVPSAPTSSHKNFTSHPSQNHFSPSAKHKGHDSLPNQVHSTLPMNQKQLNTQPILNNFSPPSKHKGHVASPGKKHPTPPLNQKYFSTHPIENYFSPSSKQKQHTPPLNQKQFSTPPSQNHFSPPSKHKQHVALPNQKHSTPPLNREQFGTFPFQNHFSPPAKHSQRVALTNQLHSTPPLQVQHYGAHIAQSHFIPPANHNQNGAQVLRSPPSKHKQYGPPPNQAHFSQSPDLGPYSATSTHSQYSSHSNRAHFSPVSNQDQSSPTSSQKHFIASSIQPHPVSMPKSYIVPTENPHYSPNLSPRHATLDHVSYTPPLDRKPYSASSDPVNYSPSQQNLYPSPSAQDHYTPPLPDQKPICAPTDQLHYTPPPSQKPSSAPPYQVDYNPPSRQRHGSHSNQKHDESPNPNLFNASTTDIAYGSQPSYATSYSSVPTPPYQQDYLPNSDYYKDTNAQFYSESTNPNSGTGSTSSSAGFKSEPDTQPVSTDNPFQDWQTAPGSGYTYNSDSPTMGGKLSDGYAQPPLNYGGVPGDYQAAQNLLY